MVLRAGRQCAKGPRQILEMGSLGDLSPPGSIAVGVIVGLISTSLQAIGLTLQRKSHILEDEKHPYDQRRPPYKRRRWQLGMLMFVLSNIIGSTIQITTLPLPVLSALQASGLVFNTIFATLILGELFTKYSLLGTILVCLGAILIATFGAVADPAHSLDQLLQLLNRRPFILWMLGTAIIALLTLAGGRLLKAFAAPSRAKCSIISRLHLSSLTIPRIKLLRGMSYGFASGILSAHSLLLAKSAVELLVRTVIDGNNQFDRWQSWTILIGMIALALAQLYYMHRGLKLCSTSVLYPFVFCIYNIVAILDGLIYFRQASQLAGYHAGLIALGTVVLLGGVLCLSWRLESFDSHVGVTPVSAPQTTLGPGMGFVEHRLESPSGDEEMQAAEREPLLYKPGFPPSSIRQRAPSLPLLSPCRQRNQNFGAVSAQIWAELDDSEDETVDDADTAVITSGMLSSAVDNHRLGNQEYRPSFLSESYGQQRQHSVYAIPSFPPQRKGGLRFNPPRDPRKTQFFRRDTLPRRASAIASLNINLPTPRRTRLRTFTDPGGLSGCVTNGSQPVICTQSENHSRELGRADSIPSTIPSFIMTGLSTGLNLLQRWTRSLRREDHLAILERRRRDIISHEITEEPDSIDREDCRTGDNHNGV